jgi:hypothetical protein
MVALTGVSLLGKIGVDVAEADGAIDGSESDCTVITVVLAKDPTASD